MIGRASRRFASPLAALVVAVSGLAACSTGPGDTHHSSAPTGASATAGAATSSTDSASSAAGSAASSTPAGPKACFGAAALDPSSDCPTETTGRLIPIPKRAASDKSDAYGSVTGKKDCFSRQPAYAMDICHFGDASATTSVALVGNSHAGEWLPALQAVAAERHWKVTTYLASRCANAYVLQSLGPEPENTNCLTWARRSTQLIVAGHYDLVVMTNRVSVPAVGKNLAASQAPYARGYQAVLAAFAKAGLPVVGIRDSPAPGFQIPACLREHRNDYSACNGTRAAWLPKEPLTTAIGQLHDQHVIEADLTDHICRPVVCPAAIGGVPVYFDASHMTATFAATLAPYLEPYLVKALG